MTRHLVFVRHASSPKPPGTPDVERPLDESGRDDARRMGHYLEEKGRLPRRVICSSAKRASQTLDAMLEGSDADEGAFDVDRVRDLYDTDVEGTCEHVWGLADEVDEVLLVGHNPTWSDAVSWLTGMRTKMIKGSAAVLGAEGEAWNDAVQKRSCDLREFVRPWELDS